MVYQLHRLFAKDREIFGGRRSRYPRRTLSGIHWVKQLKLSGCANQW